MIFLVEFTLLNCGGHRAKDQVMSSERIYIQTPVEPATVEILISQEHQLGKCGDQDITRQVPAAGIRIQSSTELIPLNIWKCEVKREVGEGVESAVLNTKLQIFKSDVVKVGKSTSGASGDRTPTSERSQEERRSLIHRGRDLRSNFLFPLSQIVGPSRGRPQRPDIASGTVRGQQHQHVSGLGSEAFLKSWIIGEGTERTNCYKPRPGSKKRGIHRSVKQPKLV